MKAQRVETWVAEVEDKPGALAAQLKALAAGKVNLEFLLARRQPDKPGTGVVFASPIKGKKQTNAAEAVGFRKTESLFSVRVEGTDKSGQGARLTQALADAGLNLRGLSATAMGRKFVCYIALDTEADAAKAVRILKGL